MSTATTTATATTTTTTTPIVNNACNLIDHRALYFSKHTTLKSLNHKIRYMGIIDKNLEQLKILNKYIFPIQYRDKVYNQILKNGPEMNIYILFNDIPVGICCCRLETQSSSTQPTTTTISLQNNTENTTTTNKLYIMLIGVLPKYRKLGLGNLIMNEKIEEWCKKFNVKTCYLHVQCTNESAIKFYEKYNFKIVKTLENYYENDNFGNEDACRDCYLMEKEY